MLIVDWSFPLSYPSLTPRFSILQLFVNNSTVYEKKNIIDLEATMFFHAGIKLTSCGFHKIGERVKNK